MKYYETLITRLTCFFSIFQIITRLTCFFSIFQVIVNFNNETHMFLYISSSSKLRFEDEHFFQPIWVTLLCLNLQLVQTYVLSHSKKNQHLPIKVHILYELFLCIRLCCSMWLKFERKTFEEKGANVGTKQSDDICHSSLYFYYSG